MDYQLSRSEKKRRAKNVEELAAALVGLSPQDIRKLPCDDFIKSEILATQPLKAGARKRQIKYLTKNLRKLDTGPLFDFMEEEKGSHLKQKKEFHELENLRDTIINEAIAAAETADEVQEELDRSWDSPALDAAAENFPDLDVNEVRTSAWRYTRNRKTTFSREIFRLLKAASERKKWSTDQESGTRSQESE
ncbi:MAG: ribosome biogenesis factor YjgA [Pseudomonadota bacterium]